MEPPKIQPIYKQTYYHLFPVGFPPKVPILSQSITILSVNPTKNLRITSPPTIPLDPFTSTPINSCCPCPIPPDLPLTSHPTTIPPEHPGCLQNLSTYLPSPDLQTFPHVSGRSIFLPRYDHVCFHNFAHTQPEAPFSGHF